MPRRLRPRLPRGRSASPRPCRCALFCPCSSTTPTGSRWPATAAARSCRSPCGRSWSARCSTAWTAPRRSAGPRSSSPATTARRATSPPTCGPGCTHGPCASIPHAASPMSPISPPRRTSSACASPPSTRSWEQRPGTSRAEVRAALGPGRTGRSENGARPARWRPRTGTTPSHPWSSSLRWPSARRSPTPRCARRRMSCASASSSTSRRRRPRSWPWATSASTRSRIAASSRSAAASSTSTPPRRIAPSAWTSSTSRSSPYASSPRSPSARSGRRSRSRSRRPPNSLHHTSSVET